MQWSEMEYSKKAKKFDPLVNICDHPTLLQLRGSDGGIQHAVTVVDGWIFDSAESHALELTFDNLSRCCGPGVVFQGVWQAHRFKHP